MSDESTPKAPGAEKFVTDSMQGPRLRRRTRVRLLSILVSIGLTCVILDVTVRMLLASGALSTPSLWLFEESQQGVVFDPITGFRLGAGPTRVLRVTEGEIEYSSEMRGNNLGFPDAEDFFPQRPEGRPNLRRYAVFGDSFGASMVVETPWCEIAEEQASAGGRPVELLNIALDGIGLASWHGVLTRILEPQEYQLDGVVFAVFPSDLKRRLMFWDHSTGARPRHGRWPNWDEETYPQTLAEVQSLLRKQSAFIVSRSEFEDALAGDWTRFRMPAFRHSLLRRIAGGWGGARAETEAHAAGRRRTVAEVAATLDRMGLLQRIVVAIPSREMLLDGDTRVPRMTRVFAEQIGAELWNGHDAFEGLTAEEVHAHWLPHDAHWAQRGADRFAKWFAERLAQR